MKIRSGFVSNSSSASFLIPISCLTIFQRLAIKCYPEMAKIIEREKGESIFGWTEDPDSPSWLIKEDDYNIKGLTYMDNFDMSTFLDIIGVPRNKIQYSDHCPYEWKEFLGDDEDTN